MNEPSGAVVQVDPHVFDGSAPVRVIAHLGDGTWLVGGPDFVHVAEETLKEISLSELRSYDATIAIALDLPPGWQAWRHADDEPWTREASPAGPTFLLQFEVRPTEENSEEEARGAFVNCWIVRSTVEEASEVARGFLEGEWEIVDEEEPRIVTREDVPDGALPNWRQAQIDGETFVLQLYPTEDEAG